MGKVGVPQRHKKQRLRIAADRELELPVSNHKDIWDDTFGWVVRHDKPTIHWKACTNYFKRKVKSVPG